MAKILVLVDCQYGFIEGGNLAVEGAKNVMDKLASFIRENGQGYDKIVLTADWHPHTHCSFKDNGGIWPEHCVQFTHDAAIYQPIIDSLNEIKADYTVLTKGLNEDHEEYSVFKNEESRKKFIKIYEALNAEYMDFCGIALNYCVADSANDARKLFSKPTIHVLKEFCPSIGDPSEALATLENNDVKVLF